MAQFGHFGHSQILMVVLAFSYAQKAGTFWWLTILRGLFDNLGSTREPWWRRGMYTSVFRRRGLVYEGRLTLLAGHYSSIFWPNLFRRGVRSSGGVLHWARFIEAFREFVSPQSFVPRQLAHPSRYMFETFISVSTGIGVVRRCH